MKEFGVVCLNQTVLPFTCCYVHAYSLYVLFITSWRRSARAGKLPQMCPHKRMMFQLGRVLSRALKGFFPRQWGCFRLRLTAATTPARNPNPNRTRNPNPQQRLREVGRGRERPAWLLCRGVVELGKGCCAGTSKEVSPPAQADLREILYYDVQ